MSISNRMAKIFRRKEIDCQQVRALSSDYLEGGPAPPSRTKIHAHLRVCRSCTAFIKSLASTITMLGKLPKPKPPPSLKRKIHERVENRR